MKKLVLLVVFILSACCLSAGNIADKDTMVYVCGPCGSSCDELQFDKPGTCPHCGMSLVEMSLADFRKQLSLTPVTINIYLQDGVEILDFAGPMEVFSAAGFKVFTVSKTREKIRSQGMLSLVADYDITNAPKADVLVVLGGNTGPAIIDEQVLAWIKAQSKSTKYYLSVCTGAFILGRAGLLDNLTATTYHTQIENLKKVCPHTRVLADTRFVDNGNVITTAGVSAGIDGALRLVEKLRGLAYARGVASAIEYDKWLPGEGLIVGKK